MAACTEVWPRWGLPMKRLEWLLRPTHMFFVVLLGPPFLVLLGVLIVVAFMRRRNRASGKL